MLSSPALSSHQASQRFFPSNPAVPKIRTHRSAAVIKNSSFLQIPRKSITFCCLGLPIFLLFQGSGYSCQRISLFLIRLLFLDMFDCMLCLLIFQSTHTALQVPVITVTSQISESHDWPFMLSPWRSIPPTSKWMEPHLESLACDLWTSLHPFHAEWEIGKSSPFLHIYTVHKMHIF